MSKRTVPSLVSIIIPVFNVEAYLTKCITSVQGQTYKNLQIVLVDDGSTDRSPDVCDEFRQSDKRIIVLHQENAGVSVARNEGLKVAKGEYVCFVDADDYIAPNYVQRLLDTAKKARADIAVCGIWRVEEGSLFNRDVIKPGLLDRWECMKRMLTSEDIGEIAIWNKIYKRSLFVRGDVTFPIGKLYSEDVLALYKLYCQAARIAYTDDCLYYYVQRSSSATNIGYNEAWLHSLELQDEIVEDIKRKCPNLVNASYKFRLRFTFTLVEAICRCKKPDISAMATLSKWSRSNLRRLLFNRSITVDKKMRALILASGWRPYFFARWILNGVKRRAITK